MPTASLPPALALWRTSYGRSEGPARVASRVQTPALLLACGNSLRQDDGVGLRIAEAAEQLFPASCLRIIAAQQFTPEMASELAITDLALFIDASANDEPGAIRVQPVGACASPAEIHGIDPPALLAMAKDLYGNAPARAFTLTVGVALVGYGEDLSGPMRQAVPRAVRLLGNLLRAFAGPGC